MSASGVGPTLGGDNLWPAPAEYETAGAWIRALRLHFGDNQRRFSKKTGTVQCAISHYEAGIKSPTLRILRRITDAYDLPSHAFPELVLRHFDSIWKTPADYEFVADWKLSQWVAAIRRRAGDAVADVARKIGTLPFHVRGVEDGSREPCPAFLRPFCQAYEVPVGWWPSSIRNHPVPSRHYYDSDGEWIRAIQVEFGETRQQMARRLGILIETLASYEQNKAPSPSAVLKKICTTYGFTEDMWPATLKRPTQYVSHLEYPLKGQWVRALREHFGDSCETLGAKISLLAGKIAAYEENQNPLPPHVLREICRTYDLPRESWPIGANTPMPLPRQFRYRREWLSAIRNYYGDSAGELGAKIQVTAQSVRHYELERLEIPDPVWESVLDVYAIPENARDRWSRDIPLRENYDTENSWVRALRTYHGRDVAAFWKIINVKPKAGEEFELDGTLIPRDILLAVCREYGVVEEIMPQRLRDSVLPMPHEYAKRGNWLKALRLHVGESGLEMAKKIGIQVSHYELGRKNISLDIMRTVWEVYKLSPPFSVEVVKGGPAPEPEQFRTIGEWIRAIRLYYEFSNVQISRACSIHRLTLPKFEAGKSKPRIPFLRNFRDLFNIPNESLTKALVRFYGAVKDGSHEAFWDLIATPVGSDEERTILNRIAIDYLPVARSEASHARHFGLEQDDKMQIAAMAILRAAQYYVPTAESNAHIYLRSWCYWALVEEKSKRYYESIPRREVINIRKVRRALAELTTENARMPTDKEVAEICNLDVQTVNQCRAFIRQRRVTSLDAPLRDRDQSMGERIGSTPEEFSLVEMRATLAEIFSDNAPAAELVMRSLVEHEEVNDIARDLGLDVSQAAEILQDAVGLLRGRWEPADENEVEASAPIRRQAPPPTPRRSRPRPPLH